MKIVDKNRKAKILAELLSGELSLKKKILAAIPAIVMIVGYGIAYYLQYMKYGR